MCIKSKVEAIARPKESQLKLEFQRVPYNQTFDFVTGPFVKILTRPVREDFEKGR